MRWAAGVSGRDRDGTAVVLFIVVPASELLVERAHVNNDTRAGILTQPPGTTDWCPIERAPVPIETDKNRVKGADTRLT